VTKFTSKHVAQLQTQNVLSNKDSRVENEIDFTYSCHLHTHTHTPGYHTYKYSSLKSVMN
jgi:hypothetical protein